MTPNDSKPLVLVVDDSVDVHRLLQAKMRREHLRLVSAATGEEALRLVREQPPATILLDLDMPGMDGFEVLRALKDDPNAHSIPVLVLSGLSGSEDKVAAFDLGATDYVTKPFDMAELRARLRAALRLHHLLKLLADRADVDGLTGLGNRSHFDKRWAEKTGEASRYRKPLSIALLDIDHFKRVNDTFGHPAGDEVLAGFAQLLVRECRTSDVACRYGGEEFALIMPETSAKESLVVAERIRMSLAETVWPRHPDHKITVSIGIAGSDGSVSSVNPAAWLELADRNLYAAKHGGRNRIVVSELTPEMAGLSRAG